MDISLIIDHPKRHRLQQGADVCSFKIIASNCLMALYLHLAQYCSLDWSFHMDFDDVEVFPECISKKRMTQRSLQELEI